MEKEKSSLIKIFFLLTLLTVFLPACKSIKDYPYPQSKHVFIPDLQNEICVEYIVNDLRKVTFTRINELPLEVGGPCDRMVGYSRADFKVIQNWARNIQK